MTILSYFCDFFLFPLPKLLFDLFQKLRTFNHVDACSRKDLRSGPDCFMGPLRLSRIEIFLRMRRGPLRSFKYEEAYLTQYNNIREARKAIGKYVHTYNFERCHSALNNQTPASCYYPILLLDDYAA